MKTSPNPDDSDSDSDSDKDIKENTSSPEPSTETSRMQLPVIIGIVIGCVLFSILIVGMIVFHRQRKRTIQNVKRFTLEQTGSEFKVRPRHSSLPSRKSGLVLPADQLRQSWDTYQFSSGRNSEVSQPPVPHSTTTNRQSATLITSPVGPTSRDSLLSNLSQSEADAGTTKSTAGVGSATMLPVPYNYRAFAKFG
jgi:hypothetical protein